MCGCVKLILASTILLWEFSNFVDNRHELSYNDADLEALLSVDISRQCSSMNKSYDDEELAAVLSGSTTECFEDYSLCDTDKSYTEQEFDSLCQADISSDGFDSIVLPNEASFTDHLDCSTPLKRKRLTDPSFMDSSFSEQEWKSFLDHTSFTDEGIVSLDDSNTDVHVEECDVDSDTYDFVTHVDPEFYGNVFAMPKRCSVTKGKHTKYNIFVHPCVCASVIREKSGNIKKSQENVREF